MQTLLDWQVFKKPVAMNILNAMWRTIFKLPTTVKDHYFSIWYEISVLFTVCILFFLVNQVVGRIRLLVQNLLYKGGMWSRVHEMVYTEDQVWHWSTTSARMTNITDQRYENIAFNLPGIARNSENFLLFVSSMQKFINFYETRSFLSLWHVYLKH